VDAVIKSIGLEAVVLETDAPYLAPVPYRGKQNESSYLPLVAEKLALTTGCSLEEVASITTQNAGKLFKLP
jgi:TatD DNase family protein